MQIKEHDTKPVLAIIVPTRNRAALAISAIRSVIESRNSRLSITVSDNSTDPEEAAALRLFVEKLSDRRLRYIRPASSLPMAEHWDWAIGQVLEQDSASHIAVLTDRFVFRPDAIEVIDDVVSKNRDRIVLYKYDNVFDHVVPCKIFLTEFSGETISCRTDDVLSLNASLRSFELVPVLLNCIVPRPVLMRVKDRFGSFCQSIAPDFAFGFRALAIEDDIVVVDIPLSVNWGRDRSNGFSQSLGVNSKDGAEFMKDIGSGAFSDTMFPSIATVGNTIMNEYLKVKRMLGDGGVKFPDVHLNAYHQHLFNECGWLENLALGTRYRQMLLDAGLVPEGPNLPAPWAPDLIPQEQSLRQRTNPAKGLILNRWTWPAWWMLLKMGAISDLPWYLRVKQPHHLSSPDRAVQYALRVARRPTGGLPAPIVSSNLGKGIADR